ncbi:MAG TPA: chemotaxis protein CheB [Kofleriaceae bacterium]|nr:chemotaxis protein CheB [Kofleriaceae bacterium]
MTSDSQPSVAPTEGRIVGIGASAGGLESLQQLFDALPADTGMAFVVIQHLSPDFRSLMDELIARHSEMPVVVADDNMPVHANHIYVMPPRKQMIIRDRHLVLTDKEPQAFTLPIDTFFRSLAQDVGDQAVAIVLSGSGSDGSRGVVEVKRVGGLVLAETASSAKFDSMPMSAAATGVVDHAHPPRDLARVLCGLPPREQQPETSSLSDDPAMDGMLRLLRDHFGIDFSLYKTTTVGRRIQRRVSLLNVDGLQGYLELLRSNADELNTLYQDLLIGVTQFFRDPEAFARLEREVIPALLDKVPPDEEIRLWVAGCATGEEAYSLAMLFWEALTERGRTVRLKMLATDVHQASLEYAGIGVYGEDQLQFVDPKRLARFFTKRASGYQISQDLRQLIVFARHNVIKDAPFTKMHFISCRNMLIYFQPQAQRTVLSLFHFGLASGGVLFLGASETPGPLSDEFDAIDDHWKIFRKRRDVHLLSQIRLPVNRQTPRRPALIDLPRSHAPDPLILQTYDQLLDRFMPPGFLIDEDYALIDSFGGAEHLLKVRRRRPSRSLLDLLDDDLRAAMSAAIHRAVKERAPVAFSGVHLPPGTQLGARRSQPGPAPDGLEGLRVTLTAEPLLHPRTGARHVLITLQPDSSEAAAPEPRPASAVQASREHMDTLETELAYTRETLQATIEELETSNEEMQATNEELVASNEELQSTNEELHSVNEELYTVNAEYQQKIAELKELNTDMAHLLEGTDVGTVFLDGDLRIRRFTSRIASVFRFQPFDIGRRISDFSHNIERPQLMEEIEQVRANGATVEDEVRDRGSVPYFLRILPYRIGRGSDVATDQVPIDGVVLTLTDISALDRARAHLAELSAIVASSEDAIIGNTLDGVITTWNRGAERLYGYPAEQAIGKSLAMLVVSGHEDELAAHLEHLRRGEKVEHVQSLARHADGHTISISISLTPIYARHGVITGISAIGRDISALLAAQHELQQRQGEITTLLGQAEENARRREQFIAMLSHELRNPLAAVMNASALLRRQPDIDVVARCQAVIERQARHMKRLLDDLLDVSRITRGKFQLINDDIDLRTPIEAAIESTQPLFNERGVTLDASLPPHAMPVRGDGNRLMQVVVNLLSNAANYSPKASTVRLLVTIEDGLGVLRVIDHGVGIESELQSKIFDLFVQSEQRLDRSRGGLGVGLSLAKNIIDLHGGTIEVHSDGPGKGSDFKVMVPLLRSAHDGAQRADAGRAGARRGSKCRIVLVDDQADSREMLRMLLESRDHVVIDVEDGPTAIEVISRERPDVAFIDIGLPEMNGYEIAQRLRSQPGLEDVMLVALTGYGAPSDVSAAHAAGFDEHLIKPAELAKLEKILETKKPASAN